MGGARRGEEMKNKPLLGPFGGVHLVDGNDELSDTESES
jgi:hypothetical protein